MTQIVIYYRQYNLWQMLNYVTWNNRFWINKMHVVNWSCICGCCCCVCWHFESKTKLQLSDQYDQGGHGLSGVHALPVAVAAEWSYKSQKTIRCCLPTPVSLLGHYSLRERGGWSGVAGALLSFAIKLVRISELLFHCLSHTYFQTLNYELLTSGKTSYTFVTPYYKPTANNCWPHHIFNW